MPTIKKLYFASGTSVTAPADIATSGGSGSGEINLVTNPNDADAGWASTGSGVTVATTTTSTDLPLGGIIASAIKITPISGTSDYARYRFTIAESLKNRKLKIQWEQRPLSGYSSGDLKLEMHTNTASDYSGTDATLALSTDSSSVTSINNFTGRFVTYFDANSSNYYEIRIKRVAGTTALNITSVIVGPGVQPQGAIVSEWESWTPTFYNLGTVTNINFKRRRVGSMMESIGYFTTGSVPAAVGSIGMPTGLTVDTSKIAGNRSTQLGHITRLSTATVDPLGKVYLTYSSTGGTDRLLIAESTTGGAYEQKNVDNILAVSENQDVYMLVPIAEWAGSGTVNLAQNDVEYAYNSSTTDADDTTSFAYGPSGTQFGSFTAARNKTVKFTTPFQEGDYPQLEIWDTALWIPIGSYAESIASLNNQGTESYGMTVTNSSTSSTDVIVQFGKYRLTGSGTFGAAGLAWSGVAGSANFKWRVRKIKSGQAVGFGIVSENASGLVPSTNTNLDNASATRLGLKEYLHGTTYNGGNAPTITGQAGFAADTRCVFIPYQMQSGTWRMRFNVRFSQTSGTTADITVNGVTFNKVAPVAVSGNNLAAANYAGRTTDATSSIVLRSSSADTVFSVSGDVELSSKPSWAY